MSPMWAWTLTRHGRTTTCIAFSCVLAGRGINMVAINLTRLRQSHRATSAVRPLAFRRRAAFTLVELLVVIGLLLVLTTIGVLFIPNLGDRSREADGATLLQGW